MVHRLALFASAAAVTALLACGGANAGVSSLPSSEKVSDGSDSFCSDVTRYFTSIESSLIPYACALAVQGDTSGSAGNDCEATYNACTAAGAAYIDSDGGAQLVSQFTSGCSTALAKCGATVGIVSTCISDLAGELETLSAGVSATSACNGTANIKNLTIPASCSSLPSECSFGSMSSSVSVSGG